MPRYKSWLLWIILFLFLILLPFPSHPDSRIEIHRLRHHTHPSYTRIVVEIGKLREYVFSELLSPDRVYVDIYQAKLNPILHGETFLVENDYLRQIRIAQKTSSTVRVVADLDFKKAYYKVWHLPDPFRIIIDIYPSNLPSLPQPSKPAKSGSSMIRQLGLGIERIVIDPGHGGKDPGCLGKSGVQEKKIVLDVAKRLKKILESKANLEVIMTRESDIFLDPESRTVIANQKQADLFISIHANANRSRKLSGIQSFYLNLSQDPSVIETAARENATSTKNISKMEEILEKIIQNSKIVESIELAEDIQNNLVKSLSQKYSNVRSLGVKGGPFWVLILTKMPSVLVEISHLSNPTEEKRLKSPQYRQRVAQGIFEGIKEYMSSLGKGNSL
jgi:N-acetylmuramoyl-L-alanine amidase